MTETPESDLSPRAAAVNDMQQRFTRLFGAPKVPAADLLAFYAEYERALGGADVDVIRGATEIIIKERTARSWPPPAECLKAITKAANEIAARRQASSETTQEVLVEPTPEMKARVQALFEQFKHNMKSKTIGKTKDEEPDPDVSRNAFVGRPGWAPGKSLSQRLAELKDE